MLSLIESLLILQQRDERVAQLQAELNKIPRDLTALENALKEATAAFDRLKAESRQLEVDRKKLSLEAEAVRVQILKYKTQQQQTRKNEEFTALIHEIEHGEKKIAEIEDREIVLMETVAESEKRVVNEQAGLKLREAETAQKREELVRRKATLESQLAQALSEQSTAEVGVEEGELKRYRRILTSKKTKAVVPLHLGSCGGCHMKLTPQTSLRAKAGKEIVTCDNCGRIVFWDE